MDLGTVKVRLVTWEQAEQSLLAVRHTVFVQEQEVPAVLEQDGRDPVCVHALAEDDVGRAIGTGRLLPDGHIGRMAVLAEWRGRGVGSSLLGALVDAARIRGRTQVCLHAQVAACGFYERYGFVVTSGVYLEAGIEHVDMTATLSRP